MSIDWLRGIGVGSRPALLAGVLLVLVGIQLASLGLLAELVVYRNRRREGARAAISASGGFEAGIDLTPARPPDGSFRREHSHS
jgi:hypothetical protein